MSKGAAEVEQFTMEAKAISSNHQRPRRLADWLNPTGRRRVHCFDSSIGDSSREDVFG